MVHNCWAVAQSAARVAVNHKAEGSSPSGPAIMVL